MSCSVESIQFIPVADRVLPADSGLLLSSILSYAPLVPPTAHASRCALSRRSRPRIAAVGRHSRLDPSGFILFDLDFLIFPSSLQLLG